VRLVRRSSTRTSSTSGKGNHDESVIMAIYVSIEGKEKNAEIKEGKKERERKGEEENEGCQGGTYLTT
jgi:hypothetical protein